MKKIIKVGTRKSQLAMWQTNHVVEELKKKNPDLSFEVIKISTKGDKMLDVALSKIGDKGLFTKELEVALLDGRIDFAVHSMKDLPTVLPDGLQISATTERYDSRDVLISPKNYTFKTLPKGAKVGTSSLRRRSQILHHRPDLDLQDLRGNLNTRLEKMEKENFDAIILAAAGVERLGWKDIVTEKLDYDSCLPAVGQGSLGIETRENDEEIIKIVRSINDDASEACVNSERALLKTLEGGCQIPIGAHAVLDGDELVLEAMVASLDGRKMIKDKITGACADAKDLGVSLAKRLKEQGATEILDEIR